MIAALQLGDPRDLPIHAALGGGAVRGPARGGFGLAPQRLHPQAEALDFVANRGLLGLAEGVVGGLRGEAEPAGEGRVAVAERIGGRQ